MLQNRTLFTYLFVGFALLIGAVAVFDIYGTPYVFVSAGAALLLVAAPLLLAPRLRLTRVKTTILAVVFFVLFLVPAGLPGELRDAVAAGSPLSIAGGVFRAYGAGLAGIVTGWKQLLTLSLPVGDYQAVLVPWFLVAYVTALVGLMLGRAGTRLQLATGFVPFLPLLFATVFGAARLTNDLGVFTIPGGAKEQVLWLLAALLGGVWVWVHSSSARRAALQRGKTENEKQRLRGMRVVAGCLSFAVALGVAWLVSPGLAGQGRQVARDAVDPAVVLARVPSLLSSYRSAKSDRMLEGDLFSVSVEGDVVPARLPIAVLPDFNGSEFGIGSASADRFVHFTSPQKVKKAVRITVKIGGSYSGVWLPGGKFATVPQFFGARAAELSDALFTNSALGASLVALPEQEAQKQQTGFAAAAMPGLQKGDSFTASVEGAYPGADSLSAPTGKAQDFSRTLPQLTKWLQRQQFAVTPAGFAEAVKTLRMRGYLSHSLSRDEGSRLWLQKLQKKYGTSFSASPGGHTMARVENLFKQLNEQEQAAGADRDEKKLVAAVGDDEQFATAAALMARAFGYDSRVVVGVRMGKGVDGVPACEKTCRGEHLAAWVEVKAGSGSWVPFDVTPQVKNAPQQISAGEQHPQYVTVPQEQDAKVVEPPQGSGERGNADKVAEPQAVPSWVLALVLKIFQILLLVFLLLLPLLWLLILVRMRASLGKRFMGQEEQHVLLWEKLVAGMYDAGVDLPRNGTRQMVAAAIGDDRAVQVASFVDGAVFAGGASAEGTAYLRSLVDSMLREKRASLPVFRRMLAIIGWRSFWAARPRPRKIWEYLSTAVSVGVWRVLHPKQPRKSKE